MVREYFAPMGADLAFLRKVAGNIQLRRLSRDRGERNSGVKGLVAHVAGALGLVLALSACTNPYDPGQRAVAGGLIGVGAGAAIGAAAGGGPGAATGAAFGGAP